MSTSRRALIGASCATVGIALLGCRDQPPAAPAGEAAPDPDAAWRPGGWFRQEAVDASAADQGTVRARLDDAWHEIPTAALPDAFLAWSLSERLRKLDELAERGFDPRALEGPHNACVATVGGPMRGSFTSLNTAYKGVGWLPRPERLAAAVASLEARAEVLRRADLGGATRLLRALDVLREIYLDRDLFDRRRQVSLELFAAPGAPTHTFANLLANPVASLSFLAFPTYEIRAVAELIHPLDPALSEAQRLAVAWTNGVHDLAHGAGGPRRITCVYHVIELYDDTPSDGGRGRRVAPA